MEHSDRNEFAHQAKQMSSAPAFHAAPVLDWFARAVANAPSDRVLDLACGPGIVAEAVARHAGQVVGIDATPEMLRLARERSKNACLANATFGVASAEWLPFKDAEFSQVLTRLAFHHFANVPRVLAEVRRVLRPSGRLVVADVVSSEDAEESALHNSLEQLRDPTHVRMPAPRELREAVKSAGFRLLSEETWEQQRSFAEWAAIIAEPTRTQPLEQVMRALARAGQGAGMNLREESGQLLFTHRWMLAIAEAG